MLFALLFLFPAFLPSFLITQGSSFDTRADSEQIPVIRGSLDISPDDVSSMDEPTLRLSLYKALHFVAESVCFPSFSNVFNMTTIITAVTHRKCSWRLWKSDTRRRDPDELLLSIRMLSAAGPCDQKARTIWRAPGRMCLP